MMRVSFDLDDTLFLDDKKYETEPPLSFPYRLIYKEHLRKGTIDLLQKIHQADIELWIYTTSFRSERYIRHLFKHYGVQLDEVVNGERHLREVQANKKEPMPSKYPSYYRIDLHIDDDISVVQNGKIYGFNVFLIKNEMPNWADNIWSEIVRIREKYEQ
ncbi:MAG: HAD family hydrolase [Acutalibacteraceae bacterium]